MPFYPVNDCMNRPVVETFSPGMFIFSGWVSDYVHDKMLDKITYPSPIFIGPTVEASEWMSNFMHFTGYVITYPCWDQ